MEKNASSSLRTHQGELWSNYDEVARVTAESWITAGLSPEQKALFSGITRRTCILASAGSGKTQVLVRLLAADLAAGVPSSHIVAFTFTAKAAEELLARVHLLAAKHLPGVPLTGMYIGTIHGWCFQYLLSQSAYYNFASLDELHVDSLASRLYDTLGLEAIYGLSYPRGVTRFLADLEVFYNEHLSLDEVPPGIRPGLSTFFEILVSNRLLTFGDMIRSAVTRLEADGPVAGLGALYVDEYQDVNPAQVALIRAMLPNDARLAVVGDELQCIYQWRGSDVRRIVDFADDFDGGVKHRLSTNYRSRPEIVRLATAVAENVSLRDPDKKMIAARPDLAYATVCGMSLTSDGEQTAAVVEIARRLHDEGVPWNGIAVLLRSVVSWGGPLVEALTVAGIPVRCPMLSRGGRFIDEFLLRVLDWLRIEHTEPRNELEEQQAEEGSQRLWESVREWVGVPNAEAEFWTALHEWNDEIQGQRNAAYDVRGRLYDFLDRCAVRISPTDHALMVGLGVASQVIRSVEEIQRRRLRGQSRRTPRGVMAEVYFALVRHRSDFGESAPIDETDDGVLITTIHQAKGLEWPIVILPMLLNRRFPIAQRGHGTSYPDEVASRYGTSLEDEWRLLYVATTRARERLFLISPTSASARSTFMARLEDQHAFRGRSIEAVAPEVWRVAPDDLSAHKPAPLRIGLSDVLIYLECPYQFGLRRVVDVQPSVGEELGFGMGLHELIRRRLGHGEPWTAAELTRQVDDHVHLPYMSEGSEGRSRRVIEDRLSKLERLGVFDTHVESEIPVEVVLDGGIVYGIVDGIQVNDDGTILVRDWKSSIHQGFLARYERQLQFYAHALRGQGRAVSGADLIDVRGSAEREQLVRIEIDIREDTVHSLVRQVQSALRGIAAGEFPAVPQPGACASCDMYRICSERQPSAARQ